MRALPDNAFVAARVAARLSRVQRRAVERGGISDERPETILILMNEMLFYREPTENTTSYSFELTRFGEAVRDALRLSGPTGR